ncbi:wall-associated receptor kinase 2-like protein [Tanacetum coccineum]|uniref:Wall-associated receptor kinase 2-like protein n=1 Tax=Tanacetum coccineum TaxID=301880 RepID=A0ABQ4ZN10_9ASTR
MALGTLQGSKQGCQPACGNITVPYPFGIGKDTGCSLDKSFYMTCNTSYEPSKLFLASSILEVHSFSDSELRLFTGVSYKCYNKSGDIYSEYSRWTSLSLSAYTYTFSERNKFTVVGCDDIAFIEVDSSFSGCRGLCSKLSDVDDIGPNLNPEPEKGRKKETNSQRDKKERRQIHRNGPTDEGECSGKGCCETSITKGLKYYDIILDTPSGHINVSDFNKCGYAFLSEEGSFRFGGAKDLYTKTDLDFYNRVTSSVPLVLDWVIAPAVQNCSDQANECKGKSHCYDVDSGGYRCRCNQGYEGNPYLDQGCQGLFLVFF